VIGSLVLSSFLPFDLSRAHSGPMAEIGCEKDSLYDSNVHGSHGARPVDFGIRHTDGFMR
jgi:hypothetical protein